jgi:hypothetical protein
MARTTLALTAVLLTNTAESISFDPMPHIRRPYDAKNVGRKLDWVSAGPIGYCNIWGVEEDGNSFVEGIQQCDRVHGCGGQGCDSWYAFG